MTICLNRATLQTLTEPVEVTEKVQIKLFEEAIELAQKIVELHGDRPLGTIAKVCMEANN